MRIRNLLLSAAVLLVAAPSGAVPVLHTITPTSSLTADISATLDVTVYSSVGNLSDTVTINGSLSSTPSGTINLDWGSPSWAGSMDVAAGDADIQNINPGSASGNATFDLFGFIPLNFDVLVDIDYINLNLATPFSSVPSPNDPSASSWVGSDVVDLELSAQIDFSGTGPFGITLATNDLAIGPTVVSGIPLIAVLDRTGGFPGTGSQITLPIPNLSLSLPPQPTSNIPLPGCEVSNPVFGGCLVNISSIDATLASLDFTNVTGTFVATASTPIIPEPSTLALLGLGLLGLVVVGRR